MHTAGGLTDLVADVTDEFGTSETLRAVIYPYVVLWMPQAADPTRVDTFSYDGSFDPPSPAGTRDPATEPLFDLAEVDREALARLVRQAPAVVGVADPQTTYVVVDRRFDVVGALMSVYVSDAYVSGRVRGRSRRHRDGGVRGELSAATARPRRPSGSRPAGRTHRGLPHPST